MLAPMFVVALLALPVPKFADPERGKKLEASFPEVDKVLERYHVQRGTPGLVYGIVIDGQLVHVKSFGVQDRESNTPVSEKTLFRIASMTKSFTSLAVLKLRDAGKLSLEDPVVKWIPEFAGVEYPTKDSEPIRVRHLLTHSAGFPEDNPWGDRQLNISDEQLSQWLRKGIPFSTAPGTGYEYSNYGFALAGRIIQKASGKPYREYVEKEILAPLGMSASTFEPSEASGSARGYRRLPDGKYSIEPSLGHGAFGAMGGLLVSATDMGRYVAFMLSAFPARDDEDKGPVRRSSVREMQQLWVSSDLIVTGATSDAPLAASSGGYGYGLRISRDCRFTHVVGHGGGLPGFGSYMMWLPEYGVGIFAMANLTYAGPSAALSEAFDVLRRTGALKPRELPASPILTSMRDAIFALWQKWDDTKASEIAAGNLFLDTPVAARRSEIERLQSRVGACSGASEVTPVNWLRGTFQMNCERGTVHAAFTLAPTQPPTVQFVSFVEQPPAGNNLCRP